MNWLVKTLYNCQQATFLIEKRALDGITFKETIELKIHLLGCSVCKLYLKQSTLITQVFRNVLANYNHQELTLGEDFKAEMQKKIQLKMNENNL